MNFRHEIFLIAAIMTITLLGCSKTEEKPSTAYDDILGEYELRSALWSSTFVDLDGDGTATNALLSEFQDILGFWKPFNMAFVTIREESAINVNAQLPYPEYRSVDGKYVVSQVSYLPVSILIHDLENPYDGTIDINSYNPDLFLSSVEEACILDLDKSGLSIRLTCSLFVDGVEVPGYIYYNYNKL